MPRETPIDSADELAQKVVAELQEHIRNYAETNAPPTVFYLEMNLQDLIGISLGGLAFWMLVEKTYRVSIPEETISGSATLGDLIEFLRQHSPALLKS